MNLDPAAISVSRRRATRVRTRVVFFLLRRGLRRLGRALRHYAAIRGGNFEPSIPNIQQEVLR